MTSIGVMNCGKSVDLKIGKKTVKIGGFEIEKSLITAVVEITIGTVGKVKITTSDDNIYFIKCDYPTEVSSIIRNSLEKAKS